MSVKEKTVDKSGVGRFPLKLVTPVLIALSLISFSALAVKARTWLASPGNQTALAIVAKETTPLSTSPPPTPTPALEVERITITPKGFEPAELTRPKGRFIIAVDNRSGLDSLTLQAQREGSGTIAILRTPVRKLAWREKVDLPAGRYFITEADHPDWRCTITITAR